MWLFFICPDTVLGFCKNHRQACSKTLFYRTSFYSIHCHKAIHNSNYWFFVLYYCSLHLNPIWCYLSVLLHTFSDARPGHLKESVLVYLYCYLFDSHVFIVMDTTELMLFSYFLQPAWWLGPTLAQAFHTSPAETPALHSELVSPPTASLMTSAACKTPGSGAEAQEEKRKREKDRRRREVGGDRAQMKKLSVLLLLKRKGFLQLNWKYKIIFLTDNVNVHVIFCQCNKMMDSWIHLFLQ